MNKNKTKPTLFKVLTPREYTKKYPDAAGDEEIIDGPSPYRLGEVKVPGHGWFACIVDDARRVPTHFYDEDDGWQRVPVEATFKELASGEE